MKFQVKSSILIDAPIEKVRPLIIDFKHWASWSPWSVAEPDHKSKISGEAGKTGHKMSWDGEIIGSGHLTIKSVEKDRIDYQLEFTKPRKSSDITSFILKEKGEKCEVTWTMDSSMPFFLFFMIKTMQNWIKMDYDRGLKMLKTLAEKGEIKAKTKNEGVKKFDGFSYVGIETECSFEDVGEKMKKDFADLTQYLEKNDKKGKHWLAIYPKMNMKKQTFTYVAAVSDEDFEGVELPNGWARGSIESQEMLEIKHDGSYQFLGNAWSMGMMYLRAKKMKQNGFPFEYYWNNPMEVKEEELKTSIFFPVKSK